MLYWLSESISVPAQTYLSGKVWCDLHIGAVDLLRSVVVVYSERACWEALRSPYTGKIHPLTGWLWCLFTLSCIVYHVAHILLIHFQEWCLNWSICNVMRCSQSCKKCTKFFIIFWNIYQRKLPSITCTICIWHHAD
jgi:hypothetical protein